MVQVNTSYPDFSAGEISPKTYGRFDLAAYYNGARRVENFITQVTGPANFRTGTTFAAKTRQNQAARLYTFQIDDDTSFILEFTNLKVRFYRNNGRIQLTGQDITGISQANPAVVTYSGTDTYANGDSVYISGVVGMTEVNGLEFVVANVDTGANTFELTGVDSSAYTAYSSGGTVEEILEVTTPFATADLFELKFAQNGSDLYIAHPTYNPQKLTYTSTTSWAIAAHSPIKRVYSDSQVITGITKASPAVVTYAGADTYSNGDIILITAVVGMTQVNDKEFTVANVNTGANTFELSGIDSTGYTTYSSGGLIQEITDTAMDFLATDEYPAAVGFYEQRLVYAGSNNQPNTMFFSKSGEVDDFTQGTEVDEGISYTITGANKIIWLNGTNRFLAVGTQNDVYQVTGGIDDVVTPTSISIRPTNSFGVADMMPIGRGSQIFYSQNNRLIVRSFEYDFQADSYVPVDRNTIADHITNSGILQLDYQEGRPNILWAVKTNGELVGMTVEDAETVSGWHRHKTDGIYTSIAVTPRSVQYDQLWACVKRTIEGVDSYYIEYFEDPVDYPRFEDFITGDKSSDDEIYRNMLFEAQKNYIHVDSALSYYGDTGAVTMTPASGAVAVGSSVTFTAGGSFFTAGMVDREIWRKSVTGAEGGRARITAYTSGTEVTCEILEAFDSVSAIPAGEWFLTTDTVTGLDHLEGEEVTICVDGGQHPVATVSGGSVTLDRQASVVHAGLKFTGYLETNELEGGGVSGPSQTKVKSVTDIGVRLLDTLYAKVGTSYYNLEQIEMRKASMKMDRPPELFTGDIKKKYANHVNDPNDGGWGRSKRVIISQDQPFPCNVQLIIPYISVSN